MVRQMTDAHKEANAKARAENRAVSDYLDALASHRPKPGRKRSIDSLKRRLDSIADALEAVKPIQRVQLIQERIDIERNLAEGEMVADIGGLEEAFVQVAVAYSGRKGITYPAWREAGVSASVLQKAGIARH